MAWLLAAAPTTAAPLEAYGKLPLIESIALSPSGARVAVVATNGEDRILLVSELADKSSVAAANAGRVKIRGLAWVGEDMLLIMTSAVAAPLGLENARREWMTVSSFDLKTKKAKPLLVDVERGMNAIFDTPSVRTINGKPAVFIQGVTFVGGRGVLSVFRVDPWRGTSRLIQQGTPQTRDWALGPNGEPLAEERHDSDSGRWSLHVKGARGWREAAAIAAPIERPNLIGLSADGASAVYATTEDESAAEWRTVGLDDAPRGGPIKGVYDRAPIYGRDDDRIIGHSALIGEQSAWTYFAPADAATWDKVRAAHPEAQLARLSASVDGRKLLINVDQAGASPTFQVFDAATGDAVIVGLEYPDLKPKDVAARNLISFKASDGLPLDGYLTLPNGLPPKNLPAVVLVHGGPAARDLPGFDWMSQAIASRGYAVVQVNYRGSRGLGRERLTAGYGQWGRKMQSDLSDAVKGLAKSGYIDPKRVCIAGASYGGYAALAGAMIDRGVYRCAVSIAGVADLKRQVSYSGERGGGAVTRYWNRYLGVAKLSEVSDAGISPILLADKAEIPILLIHGRDDTVVPLAQSQVMARALEKAGKPVELVVQKGADHWLSQGNTRLETLTASLAFIEKHNPPN